MLGKRARSTCSTSRSSTLIEANRPTKQQACAIEAVTPHAGRSCFLTKHCAQCPSPRSPAFHLSTSAIDQRKRRAYSTEPPTPPSLHRSSLPAPKRLRSRSLDRRPLPLPLTLENLQCFENNTRFSSEMSAPRNPSPTRKDTVIADKKRLNGYNITVDKGATLPNVLQGLVKALQRSREEEPSPHAQAIVDTRRAASTENEITARKMMEEHILFRGERCPGGIKGLTLKDQVNLVKDYLPKPPRPTVPDLWGSLARPQPDSCIGYVTATEATTHTPPLSMLFTRLEDDMADWYFNFTSSLCQQLIFGAGAMLSTMPMRISPSLPRNGRLLPLARTKYTRLSKPPATAP